MDGPVLEAKVEQFLDPRRGRTYDNSQIGFPWPGTVTIKTGPIQMLGVITRAMLKHRGGKSTAGCSIEAQVQYFEATSSEISNNQNKVTRDIGFPKGVSLHGQPTTNSTNWYIDNTVNNRSYGSQWGRFFQEHVRAYDENQQVIAGLDAWYGHAYKIDFPPGRDRLPKVHWKIWPSEVGKRYENPQEQHVASWSLFND